MLSQKARIGGILVADPLAGPRVHPDREESFRSLPSVSALLADAEIRAATSLAQPALTDVLRRELDEARRGIAAGEMRGGDQIRARLLQTLRELERPKLVRSLNATGIVIHTNLGRAPVSAAAAVAMAEAAAGSVALEIDAAEGRRGGRMREISGLMRLLTCAEETLVVNNNAAAVLLTLTALASPGEVVLSRGEAVEIGGGFRIPDVLRQSGARLVEVGTTNRTYPRDYAEAIGEGTTALLKVHPSNFALSGFVRQTSTAELALVAADHNLPLIEDLGSGALLDTAAFGLAAEPTIQATLAAGASVVTASGDKLLGGPQAGVICGRAALIARVAAHPLARAVRADKTCLAGLAATLRHYARGEAVAQIPVWRMIAASEEQLARRADALNEQLGRDGVTIGKERVEAAVGGGSLPGSVLPSIALVVNPEQEPWRGRPTEDVARSFRLGTPPVFGRIEGDALLLDLRTVLPEDDDSLAAAIVEVAGAMASSAH
jgi:L-seryl-tRNA(Ser) seleniumtransferase